MSKYELLDSESEEYFDAYIEADFVESLDVAQIIQVIQLIVNIFSDEMAKQLCEGISFLQVTKEKIILQIRYATAKSLRYKPKVSSRTNAQLIFYVFAKIDSLCALRDVPLPDGWRGWLNLPENVAKYSY